MTRVIVLFFLLPVSCSLLSGCIHRQLTILSEPPGAEVNVDDEKLGTTPYAYDFMWYGWHRVMLTKPGYERLEDHVQLKAPVSLWIPSDLAMELMPFTIRDHRQLSYTLSPLTPLPVPQPPVVVESPKASGGRPKPQKESHGPTR